MAELGLLGERAPRPEFPAGSWARAAVRSRMARPVGGAGLSRGLGSVANPAAAAAGAQGTLFGARTRIAAAELPGIGAARPARARRPVYPQLCGAGYAEDEGAPEDFVPVPVRAGGQDCATLRNVLASAPGKAAIASRPCCQGPRSYSPLSLPNVRLPRPRPGSPRGAAITHYLQRPRSGQQAYLGSYSRSSQCSWPVRRSRPRLGAGLR